MSKGTAHLYKVIKRSDAPQSKGQLRNIQMATVLRQKKYIYQLGSGHGG